MPTRAVHIPATATVPPSATRTALVVGGVITFLSRRQRFALIMDIWAPVSINAVKGMASTCTSTKFLFVSSVNGGFGHNENDAALPPGAAWSSFPSGGLQRWSARNGGVVGATGNDDAEVTASEHTSGCQVRQMCTHDGVKSGAVLHIGEGTKSSSNWAASRMCGSSGIYDQLGGSGSKSACRLGFSIHPDCGIFVEGRCRYGASPLRLVVGNQVERQSRRTANLGWQFLVVLPPE